MAERLVTITEICAKTGMFSTAITNLMCKKEFPEPVSLRPYKFRASDINAWIMDYGMKKLDINAVRKMLKTTIEIIPGLIQYYGFPEPRHNGELGEYWYMIQVLNWRKHHPGYKSIIDNCAFRLKNMRSNK